MSDDVAPNVFSRMMKATHANHQLANQELQFEKSRVRFVLREFKLGAPVERQLVREHFEATGRSELRFLTFHNRFPTFPFYFGASTLRGIAVPWTKGAVNGHTPSDYHVHRDPQSTEPARFKMFHWVPFVIAYGQLYQTSLGEASGRKLGLVFPRHGFRDGMVIHNDESEQFWTHGLCQVFKDPKSERRLYVQPFSSLLAAIYDGGRGWRP